MSEFTGGDWWVNECITNGVPGFEICWSPDGECVTDHVYERSDAYLLASSKKLYEALQDARGALECLPDGALGFSGGIGVVGGELADNSYPILHELLDTIDDALTRARGES